MRFALLAVVLVFWGQVGSAQGQAPTGWRERGTAPEDYQMGIDPDVKHGGSASGFVASRADRPRGFGSLMQSFKADHYRGKRIRMTASVKSQNIRGWSGLWMRVDGEELGSLAFDNMERRSIRGTKDWKRYAVVLDVPEDAAEIFFGVLLAGRGQVWVDDFSFEVVERNVKTTGRPARPYFQLRKIFWNLPVEPVNLDFEAPD